MGGPEPLVARGSSGTVRGRISWREVYCGVLAAPQPEMEPVRRSLGVVLVAALRLVSCGVASLGAYLTVYFSQSFSSPPMVEVEVMHGPLPSAVGLRHARLCAIPSD